MASAPKHRGDFQVAIFCAKSEEADKIQKVFDYEWDSLGVAPNDDNAYSLGTIRGHHIVLVYLGGTGVEVASTRAQLVKLSFPNIKIAFVVGICGGVPTYDNNKKIIGLGDCIISKAVIQYDTGSQYPDGFWIKDEVETTLGRPHVKIRNFLAKLETLSNQEKALAYLSDHLAHLQARSLDTKHPGDGKDRLYYSDYPHSHELRNPPCKSCRLGVCKLPCSEVGCPAERVKRTLPEERKLQFHFGRIGSATTVMKSGMHRDALAEDKNIIGIEMEGCGVWEHYPTIILKAVSDYADSHKNDEFVHYATGVAACALKAVLQFLEKVDELPRHSIPLAASTSSLVVHTQSQASYELNNLDHLQSRILAARNTPNLPGAESQGLVSQSQPSLNHQAQITNEVEALIQQLRTEESLLRDGIEYWSHMTLEGHQKYEAIFVSAFAHYKQIDLYHFTNALGRHAPDNSKITAMWHRFQRNYLPKPWIMALLYMLHMEHFRQEFAEKRPEMDKDLLEILRSFDKWQPCPCRRCGLEWNYASTNWGMFKGVVTEGTTRCLLYQRYLEKEAVRLKPPGSTYTSARSKKDRKASEKLLDECEGSWFKQSKWKV